METISEFGANLYFIKAPEVHTVEELKQIPEVVTFLAELDASGKTYQLKPHDHGLWMLKVN